MLNMVNVEGLDAKVFVEGLKNKVRFEHNGIIDMYDLFDLEPTKLRKDGSEDPNTLNALYQKLMLQYNKTKLSESLFVDRTVENSELKLKIDIVKYVAMVKAQEKNATEVAKEALKDERKWARILQKIEEDEESNLSKEEVLRHMNEARQKRLNISQ